MPDLGKAAKSYVKCEAGVSMVEQGFILSLIAVICFTAYSLVMTSFDHKLALICIMCIALIALVGTTVHARFGELHKVPIESHPVSK